MSGSETTGSADAEIRAAVRARLQEHLDARRQQLAAISPESAALIDVLAGHLEGGKLLRPRFCWWGARAVRRPSEAERARLVTLGAAIEMVQASALIHDDVIDHSPTRRGRPAVHAAAASHHRAAGLRGDAQDHGLGIAIILGDLALSWAHALAREALAPTPEGPVPTASAVLDEFDHLCAEVMAGQHLDVLNQAGGFASVADPEEAALAVVRWKTVSYTVLRPLRIGAGLLGADEDCLAVLSRYADRVGTAFQLRDDLLGAIGADGQTGKPASGDITEGKRTVLLARAIAAADPDARALLERVLGRADASAEEIAAVREVLVATGAADAVAADIRTARAEAVQLVQESASITATGKSRLVELACAATDLAPLGHVLTSTEG